MRIVNTCHYAHLPKEHPAFQRVLAKAEFVTCEKSKLISASPYFVTIARSACRTSCSAVSVSAPSTVLSAAPISF